MARKRRCDPDTLSAAATLASELAGDTAVDAVAPAAYSFGVPEAELWDHLVVVNPVLTASLLDAPVEIQFKLLGAADADHNVASALVANPATCARVVAALSRTKERSPRWRHAAALSHPNCPPDLLATAMGEVSSPAAEAAVKNPNCPSSLFEPLVSAALGVTNAQGTDRVRAAVRVARLAAQNPNCPPEVADRVRARVDEGRSIPPSRNMSVRRPLWFPRGY